MCFKRKKTLMTSKAGANYTADPSLVPSGGSITIAATYSVSTLLRLHRSRIVRSRALSSLCPFMPNNINSATEATMAVVQEITVR